MPLDPTKSYIVFAKPRTGSTYLTRLLDHYLTQFNYKPRLKEPFNSHLHLVEENNELRIIRKKHNKFDTNEKQRRFELIKKYTLNGHKYIMKFHMGQLNKQQLAFMDDHYMSIFITRRNKLDRILSSALLWLSDNKPNYDKIDDLKTASWPKNYFHLDRQMFDNSMHTDVVFDTTLKQMKNTHKVLCYEDIDKFDEILDIPKQYLTNFVPTLKLPTDNKLDFFINKNEILSWWNEYSKV